MRWGPQNKKKKAKKPRSIAYRTRRKAKQQKALNVDPKTEEKIENILYTALYRQKRNARSPSRKEKKRNERHHHHPRFQRNLEHHHHYPEYRKGRGQQD